MKMRPCCWDNFEPFDKIYTRSSQLNDRITVMIFCAIRPIHVQTK